MSADDLTLSEEQFVALVDRLFSEVTAEILAAAMAGTLLDAPPPEHGFRAMMAERLKPILEPRVAALLQAHPETTELLRSKLQLK